MDARSINKDREYSPSLYSEPPNHSHSNGNGYTHSPMHHSASQSGFGLPRVPVQPFQVQCRSNNKNVLKVEKHPSLLSRFHTWLLCGKDPFDVDWTAPAGALLGVALFMADLISDFSVAWYHFEEGNYGYAAVSFAIFAVPIVLSVGYYSLYKKYPWYFAHPFEPFHWFRQSYAEYRQVKDQQKEAMDREEAWLHYHTVKNFRTSNWARVSAVRLQVHLAALPQLLFQCYTVNELLHDRKLGQISWFSWTSIALSVLSLAMYHHTLALAQDKILDRDHEQDNFSRSTYPSILLDICGQGILDGMFIVCRAVALSCFLTLHPPWLNALAFLSLHLTISFLITYFAGPTSPNVFRPDFRLILYNRTNHPDMLTAAVASLVLMPMLNLQDAAEEKELQYNSSLEHKERQQSCVTSKGARFLKQLWSPDARTFWIASMLLILETEALLVMWVRLNNDHVPLHVRIVTMAIVSSALVGILLGHVCYVTFICMPIKHRELRSCCRNKGIIAKCWFLETAEVHFYYLQDQVMQRLLNTGFSAFTRKTSAFDLASRAATSSPSASASRTPNGNVTPVSVEAPPDKVLFGFPEEEGLVYDGNLAGTQCMLTTEDLTWITETLRVVSDKTDRELGGATLSHLTASQRWQRKHFFRTMIAPERVLAGRIARYAQRLLDEVVRFGTVLDTDEKLPLIQECKRLITLWTEVVLRCITHQKLPPGLDDMPAQDQVDSMLEWYSQAIRREPERSEILPLSPGSVPTVVPAPYRYTFR